MKAPLIQAKLINQLFNHIINALKYELKHPIVKQTNFIKVVTNANKKSELSRGSILSFSRQGEKNSEGRKIMAIYKLLTQT